MFGFVYYRSFPLQHNYGTADSPIYMNEGVPGATYTINFSGATNFPPGESETCTNIVNGQGIGIGWTAYYFVNDFSNATLNMADVDGFGGGAVRMGATLAESITNLFNAINLGPGKGITYSNAYNWPYKIGHEFIAVGLDTTNLYLRNALDGTNAYGYPANQQPGVLTSYPLTSTNFINNQVIFPIYCWSNTMNGVLTGLGTNSSDPRIIYGRDYYSDVIPSPATYTPLVYPHPLQALEGGLPTPPTYSLTVVNGVGSGTYTSSSIVNFSANTQPQLGTFKNWSGLGIANTNLANTTVTIPTSNLTVNANYIPSPPTQLAPVTGQ